MRRLLVGSLLMAGLLAPAAISAQGVTTASVRGLVSNASGAPVNAARIVAVHVPSGTRYAGNTRADGRFTLPGMRVGGPYTVTATAIGFERQVRENVFLTLGTATDLDFSMSQAVVTLQDLTVSAQAGSFSSTRTGAATTVSTEAIALLPTISGRIGDYTRLTPQVRGSSFAGLDNRMNNITVDGAAFNNGFGLAGSPGDRTGVAPISLDAIEQIQVNIAPFDVRQGGFTGAGVNSVTKSGTNEFRGTLFGVYRNESMVGTTAAGNPFDPGTFKYDKTGGSIGGPIIKDRLFFFTSYERDNLGEPGTTWKANTGGQPVEGNTTRVLKSDLDQLSSFLSSNFGYETGGYEGYDFGTPSKRFLARLDYNISDRSKISLRYSLLNSSTDVLASNSSSLGNGNRRTRPDALNFMNSNYKILENIRSVVGEWNTTVGDNMANNLIVGYTSNDESRDAPGELFPLVDIKKDGLTYTTFGREPFSPNNELRYKTTQIQNNFTIFGNKHDISFGAAYERYTSENVFFPGSQSAYVYNSLEDFYTDANGYLADPNRTTSPVEVDQFEVRWTNIPGQTKPVQPLEVNTLAIYAQDLWRATDNLELTFGVRVERPSFGATGFENPAANALAFRDPSGASISFRTQDLPDANILWSPRMGFNWDVAGDRSTQVRGGTGIFSGRPAYVWLSNQIGENGLLQGAEELFDTQNRPFNPDPNHYKQAATGAPASSYALAVGEPGFKFPQLWRTNIAIDKQLSRGFVGTVEFLYSKDVNGMAYYNANLPAADGAYTGVDQRITYSENRIHGNISSADVITNQSVGKSWNIAASLERAFDNGLFAKVGYNYGESKNTVDPGSIASRSWNGNPIVGDPNNPALGYASTTPGKRFFAAVALKRHFLSIGETSISLFLDGQDQGFASYVFSNDANGDGGRNNDLIYIAKDQSEMNFQQYTTGGTTYTAAQQATAWDAYIEQDPYLSEHRGEYAERNGAKLPMLWNLDLSIAQDLATMVGGKVNKLQVRMDILNFTNLLNSDWGVSDRFIQTQPLDPRGRDASGALQYRLRTSGGELLNKTFQTNAGTFDVYRIQLGVRYFFN